MIKKSFIGLTNTKLIYDLVEENPKNPEIIPMPSRLRLIVKESLNSSKQTLVKEGDTVKEGDRLFLYKESTEYVMSPCNGTITSIAPYIGDFGTAYTYLSVEIKKKQESEKNEDFIKLINSSSNFESASKFLNSLPGSPPFKTLANSRNKIHTIIITGADPDLMSTTNQYFLTSAIDEIKEGIKLLQKMTNKILKIMITVPEKIKNIDNIDNIDNIKILKIPSFYPESLPHMIMKNHLNITVPAGKTCEDMGVCFISAEAVVSIFKTHKNKKFVYDKVLTIINKNGEKNRVSAVIGTPIYEILKKFKIYTNEKDRIVIGGLMKGVAAYTLDHSVQPDMDTIIIQDRDYIEYVSNYPCINCGKCIKICPANIPVNLLVRYLEADIYEEAENNFDLQSCIECGLCSYVCTARIPLLQYIRLGKHELLRLKLEETEMEAFNA